MTKQEYMKKLQERLESFGQELQEEILEDYRQHFAEGEKQGKSEEEIIEELGNIEEMIRELAEEELPQQFAGRAVEPDEVKTNTVEDFVAVAQQLAGKALEAVKVKEVSMEKQPEENAGANRETETKKSYSYSGNYKSVTLEGRAANINVTQSEDEKIHVDYEAKGVGSQLNYEYYQYEEDGAFYAGVRRRKGVREDEGDTDTMVKVTLFGRTIISYGKVDNFDGNGRYIILNVRVPKGMPKLITKVGAGNIHVSELELETLEGTSGSGNLVIEEVVVDRLKAHTGSGNVKVQHAEFISGSMEAGSGNVTAEGIKGRELRCGTGSGNIKADAAVAEYRLTTGSGNIKVKAVGATERVDMTTGSGSVKLELEGVKGMETTVRSGSGSVHVGWGGEEKQKVKNGTYAYGNSECKVRANTGSGSIKISGN